MSSSNTGRHALLRTLRELCFERSQRLPRRLPCRSYAAEPLEIRTVLSAVTPDSITAESLALSVFVLSVRVAADKFMNT